MATKGPGRDGVMKAVAEFDTLGRDAFLERYGFGRAREYLLVIDGREYDSKAIWGAAHQYSESGRPLRSEEFSGGLAAAAGELQKLGFEVNSPARNPDWTWDEHVLALELYMTDREHLPGKTSPKVIALSALLNRLGERKGLRSSSTFRNPDGVAMKLQPRKSAPGTAHETSAPNPCGPVALGTRLLPCDRVRQVPWVDFRLTCRRTHASTGRLAAY